MKVQIKVREVSGLVVPRRERMQKEGDRNVLAQCSVMSLLSIEIRSPTGLKLT